VCTGYLNRQWREVFNFDFSRHTHAAPTHAVDNTRDVSLTEDFYLYWWKYHGDKALHQKKLNFFTALAIFLFVLSFPTYKYSKTVII
jgi:hypothetical protein